MTALDSVTHDPSTLTSSALIVGWTPDDTLAAHHLLGEDVSQEIADAARALGARGKVGAVSVLPGLSTAARRIVVVGIGSGSRGDLRDAAGSAARHVGDKAETVVLALPYDDDATATAIAEAAVLGAYAFTTYKTDATDPPAQWRIAGASKDAIARARIVTTAVIGTRDLVNTPPLDLFPASFAELARTLAEPAGLEIKVWDVQDLVAEEFGGILAVGMGSSRMPRLVRLTWNPADARESVALVGKGITFDTGGISLKPAKSMETMKSDMAGAAAVLHTIIAAAELNIPVAVTGWLCLAENMPSGTAQRPSDIIRIYGGTSVEVLNTDAEGRLVLADALVRANEDNPDVIIDVATLTGAQGVALGTRLSGVMGTPDVRDDVVSAADAVDEPMWAMPLPEYLVSTLKSKVADLKNIGDATAGMLSGGVFLQQFVGDTPWVHIDIARPAFNEGSAHGFTPPGGTGAAVRTLVQYLETRASRAQ